MNKQYGEIGTLLTILAVVLVTAGVFIGSALVRNFSSPSTQTQAQASTQIIPNASNQDITARFGNITNRGGTDQKMIETFICFNGTGNPPSIGRYKIEAQLILKDNSSINIGGSLEEPISNPLDRYRCNKEMKHVVYTYNSIENVPGDITYAQADHIEFVFTPISGNWDPQPAALIGTMTDMSAIFGPPPTQPTAPEVVVCPELNVPRAVLDEAKNNPTTITGWNQLEDATKPESATNKRKRSLTLQDITKPYNPDTNKLVFEAECKTLPRPGKLTVNVKFENAQFTGAFDEFEYDISTCDFNDKNNDGKLDYNEVENCAIAPNKKSTIQKVPKVNADPFTKTISDTLDVEGGKHVVFVNYGFWRNYGTPQARKDLSGVEVTYSNTCTTPLFANKENGPTKCVVNINGDTSIDAFVKLPDTTKSVYRLSYSTKLVDATSDYKGAEISNCAVGSTTANTTVAAPCTKDSETPIPNLIYSNRSATPVKLSFIVTRCNGDNALICWPNRYVSNTVDVKNAFGEASLFELPSGSKRQCKLDPSKFPTSDVTDEKVRAAVVCTSAVLPAEVPVDSPEYYANISLFNSSTHKIVHAKTRACANGITCTDDEQDLEIAPGTRELVSIKMGNIKPETQFYTLRVYVRLQGSDAERGLSDEFNVADPQSVYYDLKVSDTAVDGSVQTELDAADVSGNKCVNADDAAKVIAKLAEFTSPEQCIAEDINCDGVVNILDLAVIIPNLNGGIGCAANQPIIVNP